MFIIRYTDNNRYSLSKGGKSMARPQKQRCICSLPEEEEFVPAGKEHAECIHLTYDEYEVIRLLDQRHMSQEQCAARMNISRPTVTRIYLEARGKIADMLVHGKRLIIGGGDVYVCRQMRPECADEIHCCHRIREEEGDMPMSE